MILVTGANGRLGRALIDALLAAGHLVRASARELPTRLPDGVEGVATGAFNASTDWSRAVEGVSCVVHCASMVSVGRDATDAGFWPANVDTVVALAAAAAQAGVTRIVYVSSITINGRHSGPRDFKPDDKPDPQSPYSRSKLAAEQALLQASASTGIEVVVLRPPRIVWDELSGNLATLARLIRRGVPVPFGLLDGNARDNVSGANMVSALVACISAPAAANKVLLVADGQPLSTRALMEWLGHICGRRARLLTVPRPLVRMAIAMLPQRLLGGMDRGEMAGELFDNLTIDIGDTMRTLDWHPAPIANNESVS